MDEQAAQAGPVKPTFVVDAVDLGAGKPDKPKVEQVTRTGKLNLLGISYSLTVSKDKKAIVGNELRAVEDWSRL